MYWMSEPSNVVRKTSVRGAARSRGDGAVARPPADERPVREVDERERPQRAPEQPPVTAATSQVNRTHIAHHSGTGLSTVSGVGAMRARRYHPMPLSLPRRAVDSWGVGALQVNGSDAITSSRELPLLGRDRELGELTAAFDEARAGRGGLVLLTGEPGIGKTRLARALGDQARAAGAASRWRAAGTAAARPPTGRGCRSCARSPPSAPTSACAPTSAPARAGWPRSPPSSASASACPRPARPRESDQARFALFDAVAIFLRRVAADAPVVVLLDDLHTADLPSLLLLAFLARAIGDPPRARRLDPSRGGAEARARGRGRVRRAQPLRRGASSSAASTTPTCAALIAHRSGADPSDDLVRRSRA